MDEMEEKGNSTIRECGYVFGGVHLDYMRRAAKSVINVAEGAVRAGKTIDNVFVFAALLENSPDKLHLATGSTIGNAKLNIGDCNGLGLEHIFEGRMRWSKYRGNEAMVIDAAAGERIVIFAGGKNADSYKRIRGNSYGMWIATEINLHDDGIIREAFNRQLAAADRRVFWDLNPSSPNAPIYKRYLDRYAEMVKNGSVPENYYNYAHFTIRDNPVIPPERLREITAQYEVGSVWYRRDILGERCAAEGLIYRRFADEPSKYTISHESMSVHKIDFVNIGVDFGGNRSRTTFVAIAFTDIGVVALMDHAVSGGKGDIDPDTINREMREFLRRLRREYPGVYVKYIFADSEAQYLINGMRRYLAAAGDSVRVCDSAKRPIADRIAFVVHLLAAGQFHVTDRCAYLPAGLSEARWDPDSESDKRLDDFTSDIDILDAMEYSIERYMMKLGFGGAEY